MTNPTELLRSRYAKSDFNPDSDWASIWLLRFLSSHWRNAIARMSVKLRL
ncbi:MAG: hypothetical protein M3O33_15325 [Cyanobacteriota bacterium]|nr:hypothetical protein [Cyanobacteriota bacterium]